MFLDQIQTSTKNLNFEGIYFDDNAYAFNYNKSQGKIELNYFFYIYDEIALLCKQDYFEQNFPEEIAINERENFSVTF